LTIYRVRHDRLWYRNPDGSLVANSRHEAMRKAGHWGGDDPYPATAKYDDEGVPLNEAWWLFVKSINTAAAWEALRRVNGGWINSSRNRDTWPGGSRVPEDTTVFPVAECVTSVNNLVDVIEQKNGRGRIRCFSVKDLPPKGITPKTNPELFCRFTSISKGGAIGLAPDGVESWFPLLTRDGVAWMDMEMLELVDMTELKLPDNGRPLGVDVSAYQGEMNWDAAKLRGVVFGAARCTVGNYYTDPTFDANYEGMKQAGILRTGYLVVRPEYDAASHVSLFTAKCKDPDLPPVLDVEVKPPLLASASFKKNYEPGNYVMRILQIADLLEDAGYKTPLLYTYPFFIIDNLKSDPRLKRFPLWISHTAIDPAKILSAPRVPAPFDNWLFWQFSTDRNLQGSLYGASSRDIDLDWYNGDLSAFYRQFGTQEPEAPAAPLTLEQQVADHERRIQILEQRG